MVLYFDIHSAMCFNTCFCKTCDLMCLFLWYDYGALDANAGVNVEDFVSLVGSG